jgi:hypothetical protein
MTVRAVAGCARSELRKLVVASAASNSTMSGLTEVATRRQPLAERATHAADPLFRTSS